MVESDTEMLEIIPITKSSARPVVVRASVTKGDTTTPLMATPVTPADDPCTQVLQHFGWWQIRTLILVASVKIPTAWQMASILFTAPTPAPNQWWCARPPGYRHLDVEEWRNLSLPNKLDPCNVYKEAYDMVQEYIWSSQYLQNNFTVQSCTEFEYDGPVTVVTQWHLVCEREVLVAVSQFFYLLGVLLGGLLCTKLLEKISPRMVFLGGVFVQIGAGIGVALSPYYELKAFLRCITAMGCTNMFTAGYIISTDNTDGRYRLIVASCYEHFWSIGVILLPCLASIFNDWRHLQFAISVPTVCLLFVFRWIPDSPRWLLNAGRTEQVKTLLERAMAVNGNPKALVDVPSVPGKRNPVKTDIEESPVPMYHYVALHIAWAVTIVTYYGGLLNVKNIGDRLFLNTAISGVAEIVGVWLGLILILWCPCKWRSLGIIKVLGGTAYLLCWTLRGLEYEIMYGTMMTLAMLGRIAIAASLTLLTVASPELLPSSQKKKKMFTLVTFARICLLSAPFIGSLAIFGDCVSLSVFGGLTVIGGLAVLLLKAPSRNENNSKL